MAQKPKLDRRIVSKGAYVKAQMQRGRIVFEGLSLVLLGFLLLYIGWFFGTGQIKYWRGIYGILVFLLCCLYANSVAKHGRRIIKKAIQLDPGVPVTRANTADLPAPESLVRASQEPMQAQDGVLLRAVSGKTQAADEEQLLRMGERCG